MSDATKPPAPNTAADTTDSSRDKVLVLARASRAELEQFRDDYLDRLRSNRHSVDDWMELARTYEWLHERESALLSWEQALVLDSSRWEARLMRATFFERDGRLDQAAIEYDLAVSLVKNSAKDSMSVHRSVGSSRLRAGRPGCAIECFRNGLASAERLTGENAQRMVDCTRMQLGEALAKAGLINEARRTFEKVSSSDDEFVVNQAGHYAFRNGLYEEAFAAMRRETGMHFDNRTIRHHLILRMIKCGALSDANAELAQSHRLGQLDVSRLEAQIASRMGNTSRAFEIYTTLANKGFVADCSDAAAMSLYSEFLSPVEISGLHTTLSQSLITPFQRRESFSNNRDPNRKIRLGFMTANLRRDHPINELLQPVLRCLDRDQFHVTLYVTGPGADDETHRAQSQVDAWRYKYSFDGARLWSTIEEDQIDILIDLAGHADRDAMGVICRNAAPVQVSYLGYPGTTGVPNMGWIIADRVVAPLDHDELYSEKVFRLPNGFSCYAPEVDYPLPNFTERYRDRPLTFGSFNEAECLTLSTVRLWSRVLNRVEGSRLMLACKGMGDDGVIERYTKLFAEEGINPERLTLRGERPLRTLMSEYASIDIGLDPVPVTGGITTLQAMWMGVPVVTKRGGNFSQRMGASFIGAAGLGDWIADDNDSYVEIAAAKAQDRAKLLSLKRGLREHLMTRPAWDIDRYTRDFEAALRHMWREWCASQP